MPKSVSRSPGLLDGMILMVGIAIGCLLTRLYLVNNYDDFFQRLNQAPTYRDYVRWILGESADFACLWLAALTPLAFFIRLRRPRPALRRLLLQPGASALFGVMIVVVLGAALTAVAVTLQGIGPRFYFFQTYLIRLFPYAGAAVAVTWSLQRLGSLWKPEPGTIDRFGRFLGACWIATFLVGTLAMLQEGALSSTVFEMSQEAFEAMQEDAKSDKVELLSNQRQSWERALRQNEEQRAKLERLMNDGDLEALKSAIGQHIKLLDESTKKIREYIESIEREATNPTSESGSPFQSAPEPDPTPQPPPTSDAPK